MYTDMAENKKIDPPIELCMSPCQVGRLFLSVLTVGSSIDKSSTSSPCQAKKKEEKT